MNELLKKYVNDVVFYNGSIPMQNDMQYYMDFLKKYNIKVRPSIEKTKTGSIEKIKIEDLITKKIICVAKIIRKKVIDLKVTI